MSRFLTLVAVAAAVFAASPASAQDAAADFPTRPVRAVVAVPAGGGVDTVTRMVTEKMQQVLGKPITVENRSGAGGSIAAEYVYRSEPDGYTLLASQPSPITTNVYLYKKLGYDATKFEWVGIMSHIPNVLLVKPDSPFKTVQDLIAYAKANPGKLNYASQGIGTTSHLTTALFETITGHQARARALQGHGAGAERSDRQPRRPDVQRARDLGRNSTRPARHEFSRSPPRSGSPRSPTFRRSPKPAFLAARPTPGTRSSRRRRRRPAIVAKLNAAMNQTFKAPDVADHFKQMNLSPGGGSPDGGGASIEVGNQALGRRDQGGRHSAELEAIKPCVDW